MYPISHLFVLQRNSVGSVNSNAVLKLMGRGGVRGAGPPRGPGRGGLRGIMTFADVSNLNPLSPNSDKHLISPYSITT